MTATKTTIRVGAARARNHLHFLTSHAVSLKAVAQATGLHISTLRRIYYGNCGACDPTRRVDHHTESAILAVRPAQGRDTERIPADQTRRDIDELLARGWTKTEIARRLGQTGPTPQIKFGRNGRRYVTRGVARAVHGLLETATSPKRQARNGEDHDWPTLPRIPPDLDLTWMPRGNCHPNRRPEGAEPLTFLFFAGRGDAETMDRALDVCQGCPVADQCLSLGLALNADGVWGGTTRLERDRMMGRRIPAPA